MKHRRIALLSSLLALVPFMGCLTKSGSGGIAPGLPVTADTSAAAVDYLSEEEKSLQSAYTTLEGGHAEQALANFQKIIDQTGDPVIAKKAYNGLGWACLKQDGQYQQAGQAFAKAFAITTRIDCEDEIHVGYAAFFFSAGQMAAVIRQLGFLAWSDADYYFTPVHQLGVDNASVHAMLAAAYAVTEQKGQATTFKEKASRFDSNFEGTITDNLVESIGLLGY